MAGLENVSIETIVTSAALFLGTLIGSIYAYLTQKKAESKPKTLGLQISDASITDMNPIRDAVVKMVVHIESGERRTAVIVEGLNKLNDAALRQALALESIAEIMTEEADQKEFERKWNRRISEEGGTPDPKDAPPTRRRRRSHDS